ncbi:MAG: DUF2959 domain-containing protein [Proteobacteria bacterium]|jgi:hypothetical protein|nr:DUF2959 domain-containing protein [Pseudomonadota bacterium]MDA1299570.1 DUF2959 domain-containing protein [Pseudomonadota bacterium]
MNHPMKHLTVGLLIMLAAGCQSTYYDTMEKFGFHKRDILIDRIEAAQEAQQDGQEQFQDALIQFRAVVAFDGGELDDIHAKLSSEYEDSVTAADRIRDRINSVESVADALFEEWRGELGEYTNPNLRRASERQLKQTEQRYQRLINAMRRAEEAIDPVLATLKDNVLYLKHNLNARAIASLKSELNNVNTDVAYLINAMQQAINESNAFIEEMRAE